MKTRILKNGKNQYVVEVYQGFFYGWAVLTYFPIDGDFSLNDFRPPCNEVFLDTVIAKELFDSEEEAKQMLADYIASVTFTEV